jgi:hypothetical protein
MAYNYIGDGGLTLAGSSIAIAEAIISNLTPLPMSVSETNVAGGPLPYQVLGDRYEYWTNDSFGIFYVKLEPPSLPDQLTVIILRNEDTNELIDSLSMPYSETTDRFSFLVNVDALPLGNYIISIEMLNAYYESEGGLTLSGAMSTRLFINIEDTDEVPLGGSTVKCTGAVACDNICRIGVAYNGAIIPAITICNETTTVANLLKEDSIYIVIEVK